MAQARIDDMLLVAYLDGELAPEAARQVEIMAREDADTAKRLADLRWSAELLRASLPESRFVPRDGRLAGIVARLSVRPPASALPRRLQALAAGMAGLAAGIAVTFVTLKPAPAPDQIATILEEVADYHAVFARESEHLVEVPAARRSHIEKWLGDRVGLPFTVPDLADLDLRFEGGRMLVVDGQPIAQLVYTGRSGERVALCVARIAPVGAAGARTFQEQGLELVGKPLGNHLFIVAGQADSPVIRTLAERLPALLMPHPA